MELKNRHIIAKFTDEEYRKLKAKLALDGSTFSKWVREIALRKLNQPERE